MRGVSAWVEGINYSDPTGVGLPLLRAGGFETHRLSEHFFVGDFQTKDHAPYMRVSEDLVAGLESLRSQIGPVTVISGYRHPHYNASPAVGGARYSRHQAGQAADVWSPTRSTIDMARAAIQTMGCGIGLGLGENTIHVDVRGYLSTWTYRGAPLSEVVFDRWILSLCGGSAPQAPALSRHMTSDEWLALIAEGAQDEAEVVHLNEAAVEEAVETAEEEPVRFSADQLVQRDLAAFARDGFAREGRGVVVVDLRDGTMPEGAGLLARARYVRATMPEVRRLGLGTLLQNQQVASLFVYAIRLPDGKIHSGVASTASLQDGSRRLVPLSPSPSEEPKAIEAMPPLGEKDAIEPVAARWYLLLSPAPSREAAERDVDYYRGALSAAGFTVAPHFDGRGGDLTYRVAIGTFTTRAEAEAAGERLRTVIGAEVELIELGI